MKNAIIFHGTGCTPHSYWYPWLKKELEKTGYSVWIPQLPDADHSDLEKWLPIALTGMYSCKTVLIGHSAGCPLILSVLEHVNITVSKVIFVSGYARKKGKVKKDKILQNCYKWNSIRQRVKNFVFINSDNDPWGCGDVEGRYMFDHLGGMQIVRHGDGHMGSDTFHQPYKKFPLLLSLLT